MERYELAVEGRARAGCAERVTNAAKEVDGVRRAEADHEAGMFEVTAVEDAEGAIRRAVSDAGYDVPA